MEERVYYIKDKDIILNNEELKMKGFSFENAGVVGYKDEGFVFLFKAEKEWFKEAKIEKIKGIEEIKEKKDKEKVIQKFKDLEENQTAGIGGLF